VGGRRGKEKPTGLGISEQLMKAIDVLLEILKEMDTGAMEASLCGDHINACLCSGGLIRYAMTIHKGMVEVRGGVPGYLDPYPTRFELGDPHLAEKLEKIIEPGKICHDKKSRHSPIAIRLYEEGHNERT
jgi:hypothetical protein